MLSLAVSEHISLRTYVPEDAAELFAVVSQNRAHLRPWLTWVDSTLKEEHSAAFIDDALRQQQQQQGLALCICCDGKIIGGVGMHQWDHKLQKAQLGYWIGSVFEGKGIVTSCMRVFIGFLFSKTDLNKAEIHFVARNKRSFALAQRLGAKTEGILRDSYLINGGLEDLVVAGILKREWV